MELVSPEELQSELLVRITGAVSSAELEALRVDALGKKSRLSAMLRELGNLSAEERPKAAERLNGVKREVTNALEARLAEVRIIEEEATLRADAVDVTLPGRPYHSGSVHPLVQTLHEAVAIFTEMGFEVATGPSVEEDWYNFTALNIPLWHPAREMQDTFYLEPAPDAEPGRAPQVLRTHTSPVQIRTMEQRKPPLRIVVPGRTYRCDSDATHTPMFHQIEGLVVDEHTHMGHLKGCLVEFCRRFFEIEDLPLRFRPSFFPFTEPSAEVDIGYRRVGEGIQLGAGEGWLEILGCGMVHPQVLRNVGIDPERYQGFAFGVGLDRITMLKRGIPDLRDMFECDARWLRHYSFRSADIPSWIHGIA